MRVMLLGLVAIALNGGCATDDAAKAKLDKISPAQIDKKFSMLDADGDGELSLTELNEGVPDDRADRASKLFRRVDRNDDGVVTRRELKDAQERIKSR